MIPSDTQASAKEEAEINYLEEILRQRMKERTRQNVYVRESSAHAYTKCALANSPHNPITTAAVSPMGPPIQGRK